MDPQTPMQYVMGDYFSTQTSSDLTTDTSKVCTKRIRGDDWDEDAEWADHELEVLQSVLLQPFRPISNHYPPGELPPSEVITELASQVLQYAFCQSPQSSSPTVSQWRHSEDATREKLKDVALAQTRLGYDMRLRKVPREDRENRPGMRRLDSMEFLNQSDNGSQPEVRFSQAVRLSTSLQNSSRGDRNAHSITNPSLAMSANTSSALASQLSLPHKRPNRRLSAMSQRPSSLLQRGKSFTAEDLHALADCENSTSQPIEYNANGETETTSQHTGSSKTSSLDMAPPRLMMPLNPRNRLTRSQSSSALTVSGHLVQKVFISTPVPSTDDCSFLALPLALSKPHVPTTPTSEPASKRLSTSGNIQSRATKKLKRDSHM